MFAALSRRANLVGYVSTKQLRPWDVFDGILDFSKTFSYGRPGISAQWLWRRKTVQKLSKRFNRKLKKIRAFDAVLQDGTQVRVEIDGVRHYCMTDMTVAQGIREGVFGLDRLTGAQGSQAIEVQKEIFENCAGIFVASEWVNQSVVSEYGIPASRVFTTGLGGALSGEVDIASKRHTFNILFMGRDWQIKGGPMAIEAFRIAQRQEPRAQLTIIGCSPAPACPNVRILGRLDKTDPVQKSIMMAAFGDATILCVPPRFDAYGFCYLEAQYHGVVPVTFAGQGRGESIRDGITGLLVKDRTAEALAEAILKLLHNPETTRRMSLAGYEFVRERCTWERVAETIVQVISNQR
jgi:glycosyltransferase involved in cell wall biosynthesis